MARVRAAVLAAGRGVRMGGGTPKTLVPLDEGTPLLGYILAGLRVVGVTDVLVVTGHRADEVQRYVGGHSGGLEVTFVRNARYASWGNFHSVRMAIDQSPGTDLMVVNSDVIVHPDVYRRVAQGPGDLVLAVQPRLVLDTEDMRVRLDGDRVLALGKHLIRAHGHGEYAGVSLLRPEAARVYSELATNREWHKRVDAYHAYYEDVYAQMIGRVDARAVFVGEDEYAEVDTPEDIHAAAAVADRHRAEWPQPAAVAS